jgi:hypothetical protein
MTFPTIGRDLAVAWGLDPNRVRSIKIDIQPNNWPLVTVELYAEDFLSFLTVDCTLIQHPHEPPEPEPDPRISNADRTWYGRKR